MATANAQYTSLDIILRNMMKQNAALLELVAYGTPVYPQPDEFEREHVNFVNNVRKAIGASNCFVISAIDDPGRKLDVLSSFDSDVPGHDTRPEGDLFVWLLNEAYERTGSLGSKIAKWLTDRKQNNPEIYVAPYCVTKALGEPPLKVEVQAAAQALREDPSQSQLHQFIITTPVPCAMRDDVSPYTDAYFRAYACIGVTYKWKFDFSKNVGDFDALLETLMMFYQMSWSNLQLIEASKEKSQEEQKANLRAQEKEAALTYAMIQDPVRQLLEQLDAAKEPLARIQTVFSPVKGLFGSRTMGDEYFETEMQTFRISTGAHAVQICHDFDKFAKYAPDEKGQIKLATEQIAVVLLTGLEEIRHAEVPLWDYMRFRLRFAKYRRIARILLEMYPNLQREQEKLILPEAMELFEMAKYWFNHAGRRGYPMRSDFLQAGLELIAPEGKNVVLRPVGFDSQSHEFRVLSTWPMQTVAAVEALCHEYGQLVSAGFELEKNKGGGQSIRLNLDFGVDSQEAIAGTKLKEISELCSAFEAQRSVTRGNMTFAVMQLFGGVPEEQGSGVLIRRDKVKETQATLEFRQDGKICITWAGPRSSKNKGTKHGAL